MREREGGETAVRVWVCGVAWMGWDGDQATQRAARAFRRGSCPTAVDSATASSAASRHFQGPPGRRQNEGSQASTSGARHHSPPAATQRCVTPGATKGSQVRVPSRSRAGSRPGRPGPGRGSTVVSRRACPGGLKLPAWSREVGTACSLPLEMRCQPTHSPPRHPRRQVGAADKHGMCGPHARWARGGRETRAATLSFSLRSIDALAVVLFSSLLSLPLPYRAMTDVRATGDGRRVRKAMVRVGR